MFPIIVMSIYIIFFVLASKYLYEINEIIGIWTAIIWFAFGILICKLFLYTYGVI